MQCVLRINTDSGLLRFETAIGTRLIDALSAARVPLGAPCGGRCYCGKCRVRAEGALSPMDKTEYGLLSDADRENHIRLACAACLRGDAEIWIESDQSQILTDGINDAPVEIDPPVRVERVVLPKATLQNPASDAERLRGALNANRLTMPLALLRALPGICRETDGALWITSLADGTERRVRNIDTEEPEALGAAIDIGTTTLAAYLLDIKTGQSLDSRSMLNPQRPYGADVVTRSDYASKPGGLARLQGEIARGLEGLICSMLNARGADRGALKHIVCVGNTVMMHLLWGVSPEHISVTPFVPAFTQALRAEAAEIGLPFPNALLETAPCVAGYIGADTIGAMLACDMDIAEEINLLIDIGTNGEIALGGRGGIACCSAAAGPAFEGAHIRCGSGAVQGAISGVRINDDGSAVLSQIGGGEPQSLCGSGLVDAVAEMLRVHLIDETGRIDEDEADEQYTSRLFTSDAGLSFPLDSAGRVFLCQRDIREVQLAKGAIAAGIEILMKQAGVGFSDIAHLYLAGGFGNYINVHNACAIGLLPKELESRVVPIGNGAGTGAKRLIRNRAMGDRAARLADTARYIELSAQKSFTELFSENMLFEESDEI